MSNKKAIIINSLTILVSIHKIISFALKFQKEFFTWWLPMGKIFSYIHFYSFATFFIIPIPFGIYFIALIIYLLIALFLLIKGIRGQINRSGLIISLLILIGVIGSFIIFIGE